MNEEEVNIDLDVYRNQTKDFEQNYNDVTLWLDNEKPGGSPVQRQAGKVMQSYRDLLYMDSHIAKGRAELCYAEKSALKQRPLIDEEISDTKPSWNVYIAYKVRRQRNTKRDGTN